MAAVSKVAPWLVFGIDPGASGAVALLGGPGTKAFADGRVVDTKVPEEIAEAVQDLVESAQAFYGGDAPPIKAVYIEDVWSRPGEGHVGVFSFGQAKGVPTGWFAGHYGVPWRFVTPQNWQANFFGAILHRLNKDDRKEYMRNAAIKRWRTASLSRRKDEAVAAALFIAAYGAQRKPSW